MLGTDAIDIGGERGTRTLDLGIMRPKHRRNTSFTTFVLEGRLEQVFDLRTEASLEAFADIIRHFEVSAQTKAAIRAAGLAPRRIIRSAIELWKRLLDPPAAWRLEPQAHGIPASCQIFGRFVRDAGFEAILFPSQLGHGTCLAVYPDNFRASASRIEVVGEIPKGAMCTTLDKDHLQ